MSFSYYSLTINYPGATQVFSGWIQVNSSNIITQVYDYATSSDCLQSTSQPGFNWPGGPTADNAYPLTLNGFFFLSNAIQTAYPVGGSNIFNIDDFVDTGGISLWAKNGDLITNSITFTSIPDPTCFNEGTKILTLNTVDFIEEYRAIETLRKGDTIKTYNKGYRKIDLIGKNKMINDPANFRSCMFVMKKTESNNLIEDLIVTGGHSILVDTLTEEEELRNTELFGGQTYKMDEKILLLSAASSSFEKIKTSDTFTYYHFVLENDGDDDTRYGVWANGIISETPSKNYFLQSSFELIE